MTSTFIWSKHCKSIIPTKTPSCLFLWVNKYMTAPHQQVLATLTTSVNIKRISVLLVNVCFTFLVFNFNLCYFEWSLIYFLKFINNSCIPSLLIRYPIYHIPSQRNDKDLSTCFLTYHTLSSSFQGILIFCYLSYFLTVLWFWLINWWISKTLNFNDNPF